MPVVAIIGVGPDRPGLGQCLRPRRLAGPALGSGAGAARERAGPDRRQPARPRRATAWSRIPPRQPRRVERRRQTLEDAVARRRLRPGERPGDARGQDRDLRASSIAAAPPRRVLASSTSAIVASRFTEDLAGRARCLVGAPGESAAPRADRRALRRALDLGRDPAARARDLRAASARCRSTCCARSTASSSTACRARCCRGVPAGRRGLLHAAGPRQDDLRRPRPALVVHGAVRDDRAERAGRHPRLLRALHAASTPLHGRPAAARGLGRATVAESRRCLGQAARAPMRSRPRACGATSASPRWPRTS